jgi:sigma-B regulation protein RsbU (phosphoserine phosphatase)
VHGLSRSGGKRSPETAGWEIASVYEPLGAVSGDYIDIVESANGFRQPLIAFGDVAGKGVAAAMVMSHLHALLRSLVALDLPLPELLDRANAMLLAATTASSYATLVAIRLGVDGSVEIANGGHEPPLVVRSEGVEPLPVTGMPIGLLPKVQFTSHRTTLEPGDSLVLFTDGLSEAPDANGSEFGRRRVGAVAARNHGRRAAEVLSDALAELEGFQGESPRADDLSLMAIRRLSPPTR